MESAIRWSHNSSNDQKFLIADIAGNRLQYCQLETVHHGQVKHTVVAQREKLPNYTAFEWFRQDESLVAIGTSAGACRIVNIENGSDVHEFPVKVQRKCNSVAFSANHLVAVGLDRTRGDSSLNVHDLGHQTGHRPLEPYRRLGGAEIITNVKFFADQPNTLVAGSAGIARAGSQSLKLFDLRDHAAPSMITTKHVYLLSVDPIDENYFVSAAAATDNALSIWDKRRLSMNTAAATSSNGSLVPALSVSPVLNPMTRPEIWSVRYSGYERGSFAAMSSTGIVRSFDTSRIHDRDPESVLLYTRRTEDLSEGLQRDAMPRAFDFAQLKSQEAVPGLLTMRADKKIGYLERPGGTSGAAFSSQADVLVSGRHLTEIKAATKSVIPVAADLAAFRRDKSTGKQSQTDANWHSSFDRHLRHAQPPKGQLTLHELGLLMDVPRRRCSEGYLFDCDRNQTITADDPWLSGLWAVIKRLDRMAQNNGMMHKGLDFSYCGIHDLWTVEIVTNPERLFRRDVPSRSETSSIISELLRSRAYGPYDGVKTKFEGIRLYGLAICGHQFDERGLRAKCSEMISRKDYYKAIVVAVYHGRKDIAIELLKTLTRSKAMKDSGLAAVIVCPTISDEQRELCEWMAEEAEDPYLRALLGYFVSGTWRVVADMNELPLLYRVAVALQYLPDAELEVFLTRETDRAVKQGDTEGIVLTGLAESSMQLFQNYIARFGDLQTAVLATAFSNPRYVSDARFEAWCEAYFTQMQSWSAFIERVRFRTQHERMNINRLGQKPVPGAVHAQPVSKMRCRNCQKMVSRAEEVAAIEGSGARGLTSKFKPHHGSANIGTSCPHCGKPFSRCAICLLWQGSPRAKDDLAEERDEEEEISKGMIGFCMQCRHGWHPHHGRAWFAKHRECPVAGCHCYCRLLNEPSQAQAENTTAGTNEVLMTDRTLL